MCHRHVTPSRSSIWRGATQPLTNEDETLWLVCNGEICQFRELVAWTRRSRPRFRTGSRTAKSSCVRLRGVGDDFLLRSMGCTNFALSGSSVNRRLLVARDRIGSNPVLAPLTASDSPSSRPRLAPRLPGVTACRYRFLASYLNLGYVSAPRSMLQGIAGNCPWQRCWSSKSRTPGNAPLLESPPERIARGIGEAEWIDRISAGIERAVRLQMVSDVTHRRRIRGIPIPRLWSPAWRLPLPPPSKTYAIPVWRFGGRQLL